MIPGDLPINIRNGSLLGSAAAGVLGVRSGPILNEGGGTSTTDEAADAAGVDVAEEGDIPQRPNIQSPSFLTPVVASSPDTVDLADDGRSAIPIDDRRRELLL